MRDEVVNGFPQRFLSKQDHPLKTGLLDGAHKFFGMRIQSRRSRRQLHRLHTNIVEHVQELGREQRVTIMNQEPLAVQDPVDRIGQISADLAHP